MKAIWEHLETVFIWLLDKWAKGTRKGISPLIKKTLHFSVYIFEGHISVVKKHFDSKVKRKM